MKTNNIKLYNLYLESPQIFIPLSYDKYSIVVINCLKGKGKIIINDQNNLKINEINADTTANTQYKIVLGLNGDDDFNTENKFASLKVKNANDNVNKNSFMFYIYYYNKNIKNNLEVIDSDKSNIIFYPITYNIQKHKSLSYYLNLNNFDLYNNINNDILIEMSFNNEYIKNSLNDNYNLNALGALINDEFIYENVINEQQIIFSPIYSKVFHNPKNNKIYFLFKRNETNIIKHNFGYYFISIGNEFFNYNINKNEMQVQIKVLEYKESELNDCNEVVNKYKPLNSNKNNNNNNDNDIINGNKKKAKSFLSYKSLIIIIIVFAVISFYLVFRCIRKKNIVRVTDYFNQNDSLMMK